MRTAQARTRTGGSLRGDCNHCFGLLNLPHGGFPASLRLVELGRPDSLRIVVRFRSSVKCIKPADVAVCVFCGSRSHEQCQRMADGKGQVGCMLGTPQKVCGLANG